MSQSISLDPSDHETCSDGTVASRVDVLLGLLRRRMVDENGCCRDKHG